jgi:hypothetical protein
MHQYVMMRVLDFVAQSQPSLFISQTAALTFVLAVADLAALSAAVPVHACA